MNDTRDDGVLVDALRSGETNAFGVLYDRYLDRIYRFIYYKTFSKETAEDLVSDTFHKAFERIASFNPEKGNFSQWLYRIARNTVIDHYRTKKATVPIEDAFDLGEEDDTVKQSDVLLTMEHVREYLKLLSPRQREIVMLRVWEEHSYKEIADIVGSTEDATKMAFSRTMKELREKCGPLGLLALLLIAYGEKLPFTIPS